MVGAGTAKGRRFLRLDHEDGVQESIFLDDYFLVTIAWKPVAMAPLDRVSIDTNQEAQSEGYEVVCHILEQAGIEEEFQWEDEEPKMKGVRRGPKRLEVTLVGRQNPQNSITLVVVEYMPPKGPFKYHTIKGRTWIEATKRLESTVQTYNTDAYWCSQVVKHFSPGQSTSSFHNISDTQSWARVKEFYDKMQVSELNVVRHWKYHHDGEDEWPAMQQHHGHASHYRNPYQPAIVFFRVAGDEVGKKAYLVQAEKQVQGDSPDPPTLEKFLEDTEKKAAAGGVSDSPESSSAISGSDAAASGGSQGSGNVDGTTDRASTAPDGGSDPLTTHDSELDPLEDDTAFAFGALPYIPGIHDSAVERSLRRFPGALGLDLHLDLATGKRRKRVLH